MKYNNNLQKKLIFCSIIYHIMTIFIILFGNIREEELYGYIILIIVFTTSLVLLDLLFVIHKHMWYFTYFKDDKVEQKFMFSKKEIAYKDIKYIYLIDDCAVLTYEKVLELENVKLSVSEKRKLKRKLKNYVYFLLTAYRGGSDNALCLLTLESKCENAKVIKVGNLSKRIEKYLYE